MANNDSAHDNSRGKTTRTNGPGKSSRMSFERFVRETQGRFAEWVDGKVIYQSADRTHQASVGFVLSLMSCWSEEHELGAVYLAPYPMKLDLTKAKGEPMVCRSVREPDIFFVANANMARVTPKWVEGPADIAVEVVSQDSRTRDRRDKFAEYAAAGVREYWMVDPERKLAEFYTLDEDSVFKQMKVDEGVFRSEVLDGFWMKIDWLWQDPAPKVMAIAKEWDLA